jgi:hypothetical protein
MNITQEILNNEELKAELLEQVEELKSDSNLYDDSFSFSEFICKLHGAGIINYFYEEIRQNDDANCYNCIRILPRTLNGQEFNKLVEIRDYDNIGEFLHLNDGQEITAEAILRGIEINEQIVQEFANKNDFNF